MVVVVTSPQDLVKMIVKAVKMAGMMKIPVLGIVEKLQLRGLSCDCGRHFLSLERAKWIRLRRRMSFRYGKVPVHREYAKAADEEKSACQQSAHIQSILG